MSLQKKIKAIALLSIMVGSLLISFNNSRGLKTSFQNQISYSIGETPDDDKISFIRMSEEEVNSTRVSFYLHHLSGCALTLLHCNANRYAQLSASINTIHKVKLYLQFQRLLI